MFATECYGRQYVFYDDRLTVNGVPVPYSEMSNIAHRNGDVQTGSAPAFLFNYKGRRFVLAYHPKDLQSILPYFVQVEKRKAAASAPVEPIKPSQPLQLAEVAAAPVTVEPVAEHAEVYVEPVTLEPVVETAEPYVEPAEMYVEPVAETAEAYAEPVVKPAEVYAELVTEPAEVYVEPVAADVETYEDPGIYEDFDSDEMDEYIAFDAEDPGTYDMLEPTDLAGPTDLTNPTDLTYTTGPTEPLTSPEIPKQGFWTKGKLIAAAVVAVIVLIVIIFAVTHKSGSTDAQDPGAQDAAVATEPGGTQNAGSNNPAVTKEDTVEATDGFTVETFDGTINVVLKKAYVGDAALKKLKEMGENPADYEEADDPGYKTGH